jgi:hypothetical protein
LIDGRGHQDTGQTDHEMGESAAAADHRFF